MSLHGKKIRLWAYDRNGKQITVYLSNESAKVLHIIVAGTSVSDQQDYYLPFDNFVKALYTFRHNGAPARHAKKDATDGTA